MFKVLVVDDSKSYRDPVAAALTRRGYTVTCADNGRQALLLFREAPRPFDLVILDLLMPEMEGVATLRQLRQLPNGSDVPVFLLTGKDAEGVFVTAKSLGAHCLLKYCITLDELCHRVRERITTGAQEPAR
jgi:DNA-binding response OmpR family regulator